VAVDDRVRVGEAVLDRKPRRFSTLTDKDTDTDPDVGADPEDVCDRLLVNVRVALRCTSDPDAVAVVTTDRDCVLLTERLTGRDNE